MSAERFLRNVARFDSAIRAGALNFDYRTGACGPVQATQLKSWGAGCPAGYCPPDGLPESLGRWFAGDRAGCREMPFAVRLEATSEAADNVVVPHQDNSPVTMCPTRIIAWAPSGAGAWLINQIRFGNVNQIVGGPVPAEAFGTDVFAAVPIVPDCLRAGQPFSIDATVLPAGAGAGATNLWLVFLGPMVG